MIVRIRSLVNAAAPMAAAWRAVSARRRRWLRLPNMVVTGPARTSSPGRSASSRRRLRAPDPARQTWCWGGGRGTADSVDGLAQSGPGDLAWRDGQDLTLIPDLAHARSSAAGAASTARSGPIPIIGPSSTTPAWPCFRLLRPRLPARPGRRRDPGGTRDAGPLPSPLHPFRIERFAAWRGPYRSEGRSSTDDRRITQGITTMRRFLFAAATLALLAPRRPWPRRRGQDLDHRHGGSDISQLDPFRPPAPRTSRSSPGSSTASCGSSRARPASRPWSRTSPNPGPARTTAGTWTFALRKGVKFHGGYGV